VMSQLAPSKRMRGPNRLPAFWRESIGFQNIAMGRRGRFRRRFGTGIARNGGKTGGWVLFFAPKYNHLFRLGWFLGCDKGAFVRFLETFRVRLSLGLGGFRERPMGLRLGADWGWGITSSSMRFWGVNYLVMGLEDDFGGGQRRG
jgi:hypothetical protein